MRPLRGLIDLARRLHRDDGGAAMTEFVLVFPIQLFLTLCVMQFALLANAHVVVAQAAHMGARAAAVGDLSKTLSAADCAKRIAARTCAVLTDGAAPATPGVPPAGGKLTWKSDGGGHEFPANREKEAYGHIQVKVDAYPDEGYVACDVRFDFVLGIPVANELFAKLGPRNGEFNAASVQRRLPCYQVRRVGFIATPWTRPPQGGSGNGGMINVPNVPNIPGG